MEQQHNEYVVFLHLNGLSHEVFVLSYNLNHYKQIPYKYQSTLLFVPYQFDLDVARPDMGKLEKYHFGHLPVWADGNAYFAGAKPWKKEKDCCVKSEKPYFMLVEREGQIFLDTDVAELIGAFRGGLVDSDTLGRAFEPDQRFEAADGSTIVFDSDFYGNHRGARVLPGPFATLDASMQPLF